MLKFSFHYIDSQLFIKIERGLTGQFITHLLVSLACIRVKIFRFCGFSLCRCAFIVSLSLRET